MATRKRTPNERYWDLTKKMQIQGEYARWLKEHGREKNPDTAQQFAMEKIAGGHDYLGMKERDLILLVAGELPYMYD
jgi:hypothetical protein